MDLGAFCISLSVTDIRASMAFYEKLGFSQSGGNLDDNWVVLKNNQHKVGLFQGMFEGNLLTFNPGWTQDAQNMDEFTDVREIQRQLKAAGIELGAEADEATTGPAYITLTDPDGNAILIDQHR